MDTHHVELLTRIENILREVLRDELAAWRAQLQEPRPLLDAAAVARQLNVSVRTVERLIAEGEIVPIRIGSSRRFTPESIEAFLRKTVRLRRRRRRNKAR
jgi:excisionase family DNA binding protein